MAAGKLVPDDLVLGIVRERLLQPDAAEGLHPRRLSRAPFPRPRRSTRPWPAHGKTLDAVISLEVPIETLVERISGRRSCPAGRERLPRGAEPTPARQASATCAAPPWSSARTTRRTERPHPDGGLRSLHRAAEGLLRPAGLLRSGGRGRGARGHRGGDRAGPEAARGSPWRMSVELKSAPEIDRMRRAGRVVAEILDALEAAGGPRRHHLGPRPARRATHPGEGRQARLQGLPRLPRRSSAPASTTRWSTASPARAARWPRAT